MSRILDALSALTRRLFSPAGPHDDQVDGAAGAFNKLALGGSGAAPQTASYDDTAFGALPADTFI